MRYPVVLFDLDHTLLDSDASERAAFDLTMRSIDVEPTGEVFSVYHQLNQALWRQVESGAMNPNDVKVRRFEQLLDALGSSGDPVEMGATFVRGLADNGDLYAGARELLERLQGRARLAMVTNGIGAVQRGRIERLDLTKYFDAVSISGELGMAKPGPAIFDHTLDGLGVDDRASVVMVGDSLASDVAGGINAGIDTIWFNPRAEQADDVVPTHDVISLGAVGDLVDG